MIRSTVVPARVFPGLLIAALAILTLHCDGGGGGPLPPPDDPLITLSSASVSFSGTQGGANPPAQTVSVTNGGGGTLSGMSASVSYASGQPTGWLSVALSATAAPSTLTLTAATGSLGAGTYTASVPVTADGVSNSPQSVSVTFTVGPAPGGGPSISLSSAAQTFSAIQGGVDPTPQTVSLTNAGEGALSGLAVTTAYTLEQPAGWLSATLSQTSAPSTLTLTPTTGALPAGTYSANVSVTSAAASNSPQVVIVTFTVAPPPATPTIALSSTSKIFDATQGGADPGTETISITNGGAGTLSGLAAAISYTAGQPTGWLTAVLDQTTAPSTLTLTATTGALVEGSYTASVAVTSAAASNSPQVVTVTFTVSRPPAGELIALSSGSASFNAVVGGTSPEPQAITVSNLNPGTLSGLTAPVSYTTGQPTGWLSADLSSTTAPSTLNLTATTASLPAGTYTASVAVTSAMATNSPQTVSVTFTVVAPPPAPTIMLSAVTKSFNATEGGGNPAAQSVAVSNGGGGTLNNLVASVTYSTGEPIGWLSTGLPTTAPTQLTLTATTGTLTPGTYTANVAVSSTAASNSPQNVTVTFTIGPRSEVSQTFLPSDDNLVLSNSADPSKANTVFRNSELAVGTSYFYTFVGTFEFLHYGSLFKFNVQSVIAGKTILEAKLRLHQLFLPGDFSGRFKLGALATSWSGTSVTYNTFRNMEIYNDGQHSFSAIASTVVPLEFNVTEIVQNWADGAFLNNGFVMWEPSPFVPGSESYQATGFQSSDVYNSLDRRPQLFLRYR